MVAVVTGCAGFLGSHVVEVLLQRGDTVHGVDCLTSSYPRSLKLDNLAVPSRHPRFTFHEANLAQECVPDEARDADVIFHLAGEAGARASWGTSFHDHVSNNLLSTHTVLEFAAAQTTKLVVASSSSVYGSAGCEPTAETAEKRPMSPYAASKLSAEILCRTYASAHNVPLVILRYFTVYGPRQRPDMAFSRFVRSALRDQEATVLGDGSHVRDFTFVSDAVDATLAAGDSDAAVGGVFNVAAGQPASVSQAISLISAIVGRPLAIRHTAPHISDPPSTVANITQARRVLGYRPQVSLPEGLAKQIQWSERATVSSITA